MKTIFSRSVHQLIAGVSLAAGLASSAFAGNIILTGTDAVSLHGSTPSYSTALFKNMGASSTARILVLNNFGGGGSGYSGWAPGFTYTNTLTGYNLNDYAGLFVASPGRCCGDPYGTFGSAGFDAQVSAYLAGGGSLAIENFLGGYAPGRVPNAWTNILGFNPVGGLLGSGMNDGPGDPGLATAAGLAAGYPNNVFAGNFNHQAYISSFFAPYGYTTMMQDSAGNAIVLQRSTTPAAAVPLPGTLALLVAGMFGFVFRRRVC